MRTGITHSYLFVPGNRPERFAKARAAGAHAVIIDLEDSVPPDAKDAARDAIAARLSASDPVLIRINAIETPWFAADSRLASLPGVAGIVLPKANSASDIAELHARIGDRVPILPLIETARGLWNAHAIAGAAGVDRMLFGSIDLQVDLDVRDDELLVYRSQLVLAARAAGGRSPVDGVTTAIDDPDAVRRDAIRARDLGFGGKLCIHPRQVAIVNACFAPTAAEIAWAKLIVAADSAAGGAAVTVDGKMVDLPVLLKARAILGAANAQGADATGAE